MNCIMLFLHRVIHSQYPQSLLVYNFTNMHANLTDLIFSRVVVESILKNPQSALLSRYFWHSLEWDHPVFQFLPPCQIRNLWSPLCSRLWSCPKINLSLFVIWETLQFKLYWMIGRLQWMKAWSGLLLGKILDMCSHGDSIYTAE